MEIAPKSTLSVFPSLFNTGRDDKHGIYGFAHHIWLYIAYLSVMVRLTPNLGPVGKTPSKSEIWPILCQEFTHFSLRNRPGVIFGAPLVKQAVLKLQLPKQILLIIIYLIEQLY